MLYIGMNNVPKSVKGLYVGVNGKPKEVEELYMGDSETPRRVYGRKKIESVMTSSGDFTVPLGVHKLEVFVVGGGGGGRCASKSIMNYAGYAIAEYSYSDAGSGGGGGYTKTESIKVNPGDSISVSIGTGGKGATWSYNSDLNRYEVLSPKDGGVSSISVNNITVSANGGEGAKFNGYKRKDENGAWWYGAFGGSGGGQGYESYDSYAFGGGGTWQAQYSYIMNCSNGGKDGSDGEIFRKYCNGNNEYLNAGKGQGSTTRAFAESEGTLYSNGGDGGSYSSNKSGVLGYIPGNNTGGGGSGVVFNSDNWAYVNAANGGSGMVLIRW